MPSKQAKVFISSADWMPRNMERRIETLIPIENPTVRRQILNEIMVVNLKDNCHSWVSDSEGRYQRLSSDEAFSAHSYFMTHPSYSGRGRAIKKLNRKSGGGTKE